MQYYKRVVGWRAMQRGYWTGSAIGCLSRLINYKGGGGIQAIREFLLSNKIAIDLLKWETPVYDKGLKRFGLSSGELGYSD